MSLSKSCLLIFVLSCVAICGSKRFPSWLTICKAKDPKIIDCFKNAVEQIRPHLKEGVPELFIPSFDPLVLPQASLNNGDSFQASFKNIEIFYGDEFELQNLIVDLDKDYMEIGLNFPRLRIKSQYNINGRILILTLDGHGPADGNFTDVKLDLKIEGRRYEKDGKIYFGFKNESVTLNLGKPHFHFERIFGDNVELNDQTNKIVNENIEAIIDELKPVLSETIIKFMIGLVTQLFEKYTFDEFFLPG